MDQQTAVKSLPEHFNRFWRQMQRIEFCRHRADMAELSAEKSGSEAFRREMAEVAREWRDMARAIEQEDHVPAPSSRRRDSVNA